MADYGGAISLSQPHTSEEDDSEHSLHTLSCSGGVGGSSSKTKKIINNNNNNAIIEFDSSTDTAKKPRGRPPGSKNKPKPPIVITKDNDNAMKPVIIEISAASDIVETLIQFARKRNVGISILSGSGSVSDVTLRHPMSHSASLSLHGPFTLVSLSGSFLPSSKPGSCSFGICLSGAQGQIFGGIVGGKVTAASLVVIVAATFLNPVFHRLPTEADDDDDDDDDVKPDVDSVAATATATGSTSSMAVCAYNAAAADVMPWGSNSRSSY